MEKKLLIKHPETRGGTNEKTISIRVSVLRNYCPIFYGRRCTWGVHKDMFEYFWVDFILKSYKKC